LIFHTTEVSYYAPDPGRWRFPAQEPIPVWRDVNGDDALGVDMLVGVGRDVPEMMLSGVSAGKVESQYLAGSSAPSGHSITSHSSGWGSQRQ
jgi:hypothetical protein